MRTADASCLSRRMAFASTAEICGLAAERFRSCWDLLNDLLILAERHASRGAEWVMARLTSALVDGHALEGRAGRRAFECHQRAANHARRFRCFDLDPVDTRRQSCSATER